jgi:hypothetical protein
MRFAWIPLLFLVGCGHVYPRANFKMYGAFDPMQGARISKQFKTEQRDPAVAEPDVAFMIDTLPEGIEITNGVMAAKPGYPYTIVGTMAISASGTGYPSIIFDDFTDVGHKVLCWPQVPLMWASLTLWIVSPTVWPCFVSGRWETPAMMRQAKLLAHAMGGNLIVGQAAIDPAKPEKMGAVVGTVIRVEKVEGAPGPARSF